MANGGETDRYVLPRTTAEVDRLDLGHFALRHVLQGLYLAPVPDPRRVLDVGAGTGQWAHEVASEHPSARVVGLDLAPTKPYPPANYVFVKQNVLQGLPFASGSFDLVHQRLLISGIPIRRWPDVVADLIRVTRPGGWVELVEAYPRIEPEGPAVRRLYEPFGRLGRREGLDTLGTITERLDRILREAGAEHVQSRHIRVPVGHWAGPPGAWMSCSARVLFEGLTPLFAKLGLPETECRDLIAQALDEFEHLHPAFRIRIAFGRRPLSS